MRFGEFVAELGATPDNDSDPALNYTVVIEMDGRKLKGQVIQAARFDHQGHEVVIVAARED